MLSSGSIILFVDKNDTKSESTASSTSSVTVALRNSPLRGWNKGFLKTRPVLDPLRVLLVNPLSPAAQLVAIKTLTGIIFGPEQLIDLILLVYSNETTDAETIKLELETCAFPCYNSVTITSDLPSVSDADVFCFITNFKNPNCLDITSVDGDDEQFDTLYLMVKIANSLSIPIKEDNKDEPVFEDKLIPVRRRKEPEKTPLKPIFMADGLVAIDILKSFSKNLPPESFFCSTSVPSTAASVLGDYLRVDLAEMNNIYTWAANDVVFHVEFDKPLFIKKQMDHANLSHCDWEMMTDEQMAGLNPQDKTQFGRSWMRKEFIEKTIALNSNNPHGSIYKAAEFAKTLRSIWKPRLEEGSSVATSIGIISDGSLETYRGLPYVLPVIVSGDTWKVSDQFSEEFHLQAEIQKINKTVKDHHTKLIAYCKKFLVKNVINQAFIPVDSDTTFNTFKASTGTSITDNVTN